jgi:hypothetical protein
MNLAPNELARRTDTGAIYRHDPLPMTFTVGPVVSRDGHEASLRAHLSVRLVERDADIELFKEQLLGDKPAVTIDIIRQHLIPLLESGVRTFAQQHDAEPLIQQQNTVLQLVLERANEFGFARGLEFVPPADGVLICPALQTQRAAMRIERERSEQVERAASIVERAKSISGVEALRADEQATLLQLLIRQTEPRDAMIAAGRYLIRLETDSGQTQAVSVPDEIGPLRSAQVDPVGRLLLGGQSGVAIDDNVYPIHAPTERGINSVAIDPAGMVVAAHSELGLLRWDLRSAQSLDAIPLAGAPARHLVAIDDRMVFSAGERVLRLDGDRVVDCHQSSGQVIAIQPLGEVVWVIRNNGACDPLPRSTLIGSRAGFRRSQSLTAADLIEVQGLRGLVLAGETGPVELVSVAGAPLLELHGPHRSLRMICVCGQAIVGITADRQLAIVWQIDRPNQPAHVINLVARHGHRASDICCAPA